MLFLRRLNKTQLSLNHHQCRTLLVVFVAFMCLLPPTEATFRLCGFRLTMTLTAICKNQLCGGYFVPAKKRSVSSPLEDFEERSEMAESPTDELDSSPNSIEQLFTKPIKREDPSNTFTHYRTLSKRSGIATECCEKRCSLAYLRTYCCAGFQLPQPAAATTLQ